MRFDAAQHISAVLTAKQSPRGRGGYQTIMRTEGALTDEDVYLLERQAQYIPAHGSGVRWQSYRLDARRHVITRIVPIDEPDEAGRRGRFFSHSLVIDAAGRGAFDDFVLDLLQTRNFLPSLDRVLAAEGVRTGHIGAAAVEARAEWARDARSLLRDWPGESLNNLSALTADPRGLSEQGQHVVLTGGETQVLQALKVVFLLTPPAERRHCSFDTNVVGSEPHPDVPLWARGYPSAASAAPLLIDAARHQVTVPEWLLARENHFSLEQFSPPVRELIGRRFNRPTERMLDCLGTRRYEAFVGELAYESLLAGSDPALTDSDLEALLPFARSHSGLGLLLALKSGDEPRRLGALASVRDWSEYRQRLGELRGRPGVEDWQLFSPGFMSTWFGAVGDYNMDDIKRAVASVAEHGSDEDREQLICLDECLAGGRRRELAAWIAASPFRLDRLQAALSRPAAANGRQRGHGGLNHFWRRLRRTFSR